MFHGFGASKRPPGRVVVGIVLVVEVVVESVVDVLVADVDVELVVGVVVDVEVRDDVVDEEEVRVVVVVFFRALDVTPQMHVLQVSPPAQSGAVSHSSPAPESRRPSPQADAAAVKRRRFVAWAVNVPVRVVQAGSSTFAARRTLRSVPHVAQ